MEFAKDTFINKRLVEKAKKEKVELVFDRFEKQQPQCLWGLDGGCCKNCFQGPCRIISSKGTLKGICGASADVIVARNLLRMTAAGASSHIDHAREVVLTLLKVGQGKARDYKINDEAKLRELAKRLGKKHTGDIKKVAQEVAYEALEDFRRQEGVFHRSEGDYLNWIKITATKERQQTWKKLGILPVNADLETSRAQHVTTMGNDADPVSLLLQTLKNGLVDGYAGLHLATNMQDVLFGTPALVKSESNLGVMKEDYVNLAVHGHVPLLSEKIVEWAKKLDKEAKKVGAKGINVVGVCCTGHEVLMRHGVPHATHTMESELPIVTGALEALVVDTQCIYPALQDVASCYHTKIITTMIAKIPGALHIPFHIENANGAAKQIVMEAIKNYKNRGKNILIPKEKTELYAGFSAETILAALSKLNPKDPLKPLVDNIANGNILGIAAIVGCRNVKLRGQKFTEEMIKILLKNNILVVATGCIAHAAAQEGLMLPAATERYAGKTLKAVLTAIGQANGLGVPIPPVLHMGSCVDNSRIEVVVNAIAEKLKVPIPKLPIAASAPEWVTEKAVSIGVWALALGIATHLNPVPPVTSPPAGAVRKILTEDLENITGGKVLLGTTPQEAANALITHIKKKRQELGLK